MARPDSPEVIYLDSNTLCRFIVGDHVETVGRVPLQEQFTTSHAGKVRSVG